MFAHIPKDGAKAVGDWSKQSKKEETKKAGRVKDKGKKVADVVVVKNDVWFENKHLADQCKISKEWNIALEKCLTKSLLVCQKL